MASYFASRWDSEALWQLDLPVEDVPLAELAWHLDHPFWASHPPEHIFDVVPRDVLADGSVHPGHLQRIDRVEVSHPLLVAQFGDRWVILDGVHRLARLFRDGVERVSVCRVPAAQIRRDAASSIPRSAFEGRPDVES